MTKVIGLTGVIGSGKSTVARLLHKFGAAVIDTDKLAHQAYHPTNIAWKEIVDAFGRQVLTPDGKIDRSILGLLAFNDKEALTKLNAIAHPRILAEVQKLIEGYREQNVPVVVVEAPLLIEARWNNNVDEVWVVTAPKSKVVERLKKQRSLSEKEITSRVEARLSEPELIKHADAVIDNDGSREHLKKRVAEEWARLAGYQN